MARHLNISAQGVILGLGIKSHMGLTVGSLLLPLPMSLPLPLFVSHEYFFLKKGIVIGNVAVNCCSKIVFGKVLLVLND